MFRISQAELSHLDLIAPLFDAYRQFYGQASDINAATAFLQERLTHEQSVIFVALADDGKGLGFTQLYPSFSSVSLRRVWILNDLFVAQTARGQGVGAGLLEHARQYGIATHAKELSLQTAVDNQTAQRLYEKLGWQKDTAFYTYYLPL